MRSSAVAASQGRSLVSVEPVGDQGGGVVAGLVRGQAFQDRAGQRREQGLAAGEEHPADPGRGHRGDRGKEIGGAQCPRAGLDGPVAVGDPGRDLSLVMAEPASELATCRERDPQLPAAAGEVARAAGEPGRREIGKSGHEVHLVVPVGPRTGRVPPAGPPAAVLGMAAGRVRKRFADRASPLAMASPAWLR